ncbi:MAG: hypothetical protein HFG27_08480 [Provencibacterium sp.]|jgi:hypothetical protein|nr:hypothetical protein [Provencibacterium sp.]
MRWIYKARCIVQEYRKNCQELHELEARMQGPSVSVQVSIMSSKISKPVEAAVEQLALQERKRYLELAVNAVELATEAVLKKPQGSVTVRLVDMLYYQGTHTLSGVAQALDISEPTAKRYHRFFLKMVALHMGYLSLSEN